MNALVNDNMWKKNVLHISPLNCIDLSETWTAKKIRQGRKQSFPNQILKIAHSYFPTLFSFVEKIGEK